MDSLRCLIRKYLATQSSLEDLGFPSPENYVCLVTCKLRPSSAGAPFSASMTTMVHKQIRTGKLTIIPASKDRFTLTLPTQGKEPQSTELTEKQPEGGISTMEIPQTLTFRQHETDFEDDLQVKWTAMGSQTSADTCEIYFHCRSTYDPMFLMYPSKKGFREYFRDDAKYTWTSMVLKMTELGHIGEIKEVKEPAKTNKAPALTNKASATNKSNIVGNKRKSFSLLTNDQAKKKKSKGQSKKKDSSKKKKTQAVTK